MKEIGVNLKDARLGVTSQVWWQLDGGDLRATTSDHPVLDLVPPTRSIVRSVLLTEAVNGVDVKKSSAPIVAFILLLFVELGAAWYNKNKLQQQQIGSNKEQG